MSYLQQIFYSTAGQSFWASLLRQDQALIGLSELFSWFFWCSLIFNDFSTTLYYLCWYFNYFVRPLRNHNFGTTLYYLCCRYCCAVAIVVAVLSLLLVPVVLSLLLLLSILLRRSHICMAFENGRLFFCSSHINAVVTTEAQTSLVQWSKWVDTSHGNALIQRSQSTAVVKKCIYLKIRILLDTLSYFSILLVAFVNICYPFHIAYAYNRS